MTIYDIPPATTFFPEQTPGKNKPYLEPLIDQMGFVIIPLFQGTKRPMIKWGQYRDNRPSRELMLSWFKFMPNADIGIITGRVSNIMVLDIDNTIDPGLPVSFFPERHTEHVPKDHFNYAVTTPSGGAHIYYRWRPEYRHQIRVTPNIDIPPLVKFYDRIPEIQQLEMPVQAPDHIHSPVTLTDWSADPHPPTMDQLNQCNFIRRFRSRRANATWDGRYPEARAYASNVVAIDNPDLNLGIQYRHTAQIYSSLSKPIRCSVIYEHFKCPHYDEITQTCQKKSGVTTPYGLAKALNRSKK